MITRDPGSAQLETHPVIIVGGGIYGAMLALEAAQRGLRPLLLERGDFGSATSWNSLRIVHGGFRYLQSMDLHRFRESVAERRWLLGTFPDLVRPLPCLMPLYGDGLRRRVVFRAALTVNDLLSRDRNDGLPESQWLSRGSILSAAETRRRFPLVDTRELEGGALWYDGVMTNSQRLLMEVLRWAAAAGARLYNYIECQGFRSAHGRVTAVLARDRRSGHPLEFRTSLVINAAGPWCRLVARGAGPEIPTLFHPSLAFNALLDRPPPADTALAVSSRRPGGQTYFLYPWQGRTLAGTFHAPWNGLREDPKPGEELVDAFLADLNQAVPGLEVRREHLIRVFAGLLPVTKPGGTTLSVRELILDHGTHGGLRNFYTVSGVKYTTARLVAEKTFRRIFGTRDGPLRVTRPEPAPLLDAESMASWLETDPAGAFAHLDRLIREEAVLRPDDLILRRTDWGIDPRRSTAIARAVRNHPELDAQATPAS